jgi:hypothetical protein
MERPVTNDLIASLFLLSGLGKIAAPAMTQWCATFSKQSFFGLRFRKSYGRFASYKFADPNGC